MNVDNPLSELTTESANLLRRANTIQCEQTLVARLIINPLRQGIRNPSPLCFAIKRGASLLQFPSITRYLWAEFTDTLACRDMLNREAGNQTLGKRGLAGTDVSRDYDYPVIHLVYPELADTAETLFDPIDGQTLDGNPSTTSIKPIGVKRGIFIF